MSVRQEDWRGAWRVFPWLSPLLVIIMGTPCDWSRSVGLLLLLHVGGGEQTLNSTLKPNHMCAHGEGLNNGSFQQRSGKKKRERRGIHSLAGRGRSWGFYSVQPMDDSRVRKAATDEERLESLWKHVTHSETLSCLTPHSCRSLMTHSDEINIQYVLSVLN